MALGTGYDQQTCFLARALEVVGERWTLLVVRDLMYGVTRFTDLREHLDISRGVLSARLADLVEAGVVRRDQSGRGGVDYRLTPAGLDLWPVVLGLHRWGERHAPAEHRTRVFTHAICGTEVGDDGTCPRCGVVPPVGDVINAPGGVGPGSNRTDRVARVLEHPHRMLAPVR